MAQTIFEFPFVSNLGIWPVSIKEGLRRIVAISPDLIIETSN
jgi:hypothetical protein